MRLVLSTTWQTTVVRMSEFRGKGGQSDGRKCHTIALAALELEAQYHNLRLTNLKQNECDQ